MSDYDLLFAIRLQNSAIFKKLKHEIIDLIDWEHSILCESVFCQLLATFEVPKHRTSLVNALYSHLKSKRHLQTAVGYDPCFHLGTVEDIAHRTNCRFCCIVHSALAIGSHVAEHDDIHVQCIIEEGKFDLVTLGKAGRPEGRVLALGVRIVFCEGPDKAQATIHCGRPINFKRFDLEQVRHWLSLCEQSHEAPCQRNPAKPHGWMPASQSHTFRLIDVRKECVVSRPWQSRYLALSYVWGGIEQLRLEKHSIDTLKVPRSLQKLRDYIPKTIQDAITFVYLIGEKYLWVDVLCLVQDDQSSMRDGIQLMNFVYENALATIVAADGSDPHAGLRRLHSNSTHPSTNSVQTMKPGLQLMALGALDVHLKKSKWSSRSWTFQEQLLSRRTLVFVNQQVYFCCRQRIWSEDTCTDRFPDDRLMYEWRVNAISCLAVGSSSNGDLEDDDEPLPLLTNMLEYYGMRELTYERDAINAISGVLNVISTNMGSEFLQGIPVVALDYMVLFQIYGDKKITRDKTPYAGRRARRRRNFPSWSWAGWEALYSWNTHPDVSPIDPTSFNKWLDHRTWIVWYKSIGSDLPKAILEKQPSDKRSRGEIGVCYSRTSQPNLADRFGTLDTLTTVPAASFAIAPAYSTQDLLRFYTVVVILTVSLDIPDGIPWPIHNEFDSNMLHMSDVKPSAAIYDSEGCFSGLLLFDIAGFLGEDGQYELVLLSDSQNSLFNRMDLPDPSRLNPFVSYQAINHDWRLYWVLLLTWNEGVAERRGLGQILRSAVEKSFSPGPQWREIVLG